MSHFSQKLHTRRSKKAAKVTFNKNIEFKYYELDHEEQNDKKICYSTISSMIGQNIVEYHNEKRHFHKSRKCGQKISVVTKGKFTITHYQESHK